MEFLAAGFCFNPCTFGGIVRVGYEWQGSLRGGWHVAVMVVDTGFFGGVVHVFACDLILATRM